MRIKITFSYDGSKFNGFQRQNNEKSVQKEVENALSTIYGQPITIKGAGRTDAKVHACGQVAHFDATYKDSNLKYKMNLILNPNIVVKKIKLVDDDFHARHDAKKKEYIYKINMGPYLSALNDYYYQPRFKLDLKLMKDASKLFLGTHDFNNFVSGEKEDTKTTIYSITFKKKFDKLEIHFIGTGFYRYMVRNLMGALLEIAKCRISQDTIIKMIEFPKEEKTLPTAPPEGLYLNKIWY